MSVSRLTAILIQEMAVCTRATSNGEEKFSGEIWMVNDGKMVKLLLSTIFHFDNTQDAIDHMEDLIIGIREIDLTA